MNAYDEYQDHPLSEQPPDPYDLVSRLRKRAEIRRQITTRKSVQNNEPDRIADLLEEAANEMESLQEEVKKYEKHIAIRYLEELRDEQ
jgi:phage host-nuclease inhibitor protein Gam